jgi:uncharacterized membrane protein (UPF0127 family)
MTLTSRNGNGASMRVWNQTRPGVLGEQIELASTFWKRARGLLGRPPLSPGEGLLIVPSRGIHMMGMRTPLDVVLADRQWQVVAVYPDLRPWQRTAVHWQACYALELPAGVLRRVPTRAGDRLGCTGPLPGDWNGWLTAPPTDRGPWGKVPPG